MTASSIFTVYTADLAWDSDALRVLAVYEHGSVCDARTSRSKVCGYTPLLRIHITECYARSAVPDSFSSVIETVIL